MLEWVAKEKSRYINQWINRGLGASCDRDAAACVNVIGYGETPDLQRTGIHPARLCAYSADSYWLCHDLSWLLKDKQLNTMRGNADVRPRININLFATPEIQCLSRGYAGLPAGDEIRRSFRPVEERKHL